MPNVCEFGSDNYWRWGRKKISNKNDNKVGYIESILVVPKLTFRFRS